MVHLAAKVGLGVDLDDMDDYVSTQQPRDSRPAPPPGSPEGTTAGLRQLDGGVRRGVLRMQPAWRGAHPDRAGPRTSRPASSNRPARSAAAPLRPGLVSEDAPTDPAQHLRRHETPRRTPGRHLGPRDRRPRHRPALPQRVRPRHAPQYAVRRSRRASSAPPWSAARLRRSTRTATSGETSSTSPISPPRSPRRSTNDAEADRLQRRQRYRPHHRRPRG